MSRFFKTAIDFKISKASKPRKLHSQSLGQYFKQNPGHQVVMVGGLAAVASLNLRLDKHPHWVEKIIFCSETPWIGKIHPKWVGGEWGQDVNYLPLSLRRIAIEQLKLSCNYSYPKTALRQLGMNVKGRINSRAKKQTILI